MIEELHAFQNKNKALEAKTFDSILSECVAQIKFENQHGRTETEFRVPTFVLGFPVYDYQSCISYIYKNLLEKGLVCVKRNESIYITWKLQESNTGNTNGQISKTDRLSSLRHQNTGSGYDSDDLRTMGSLLKKRK